MHGPSGGRTAHSRCCCIVTKQEMQVRHLPAHVESLRECPNCTTRFKPEGQQLYCSRSCARSVTNTTRAAIAVDSKQLPCRGCGDLTWTSGYAATATCQYCRDTAHPLIRARIFTQHQTGAACKVDEYTCMHCRSKFIARKSRKLCQICTPVVSSKRLTRKARYRFEFTFDVFQYPELFDPATLEEISTVGWYAPSRTVDRNITGLVRDHRVSVAEAIRNNYDPYYITHPLNCEIMRQSSNSSKNSKSSVSYEDLKEAVDLVEGRNRRPPAG